MYPCAHQGAFNPRISNFCNDFASICTRDRRAKSRRFAAWSRDARSISSSSRGAAWLPAGSLRHTGSGCPPGTFDERGKWLRVSERSSRTQPPSLGNENRKTKEHDLTDGRRRHLLFSDVVHLVGSVLCYLKAGLKSSYRHWGEYFTARHPLLRQRIELMSVLDGKWTPKGFLHWSSLMQAVHVCRLDQRGYGDAVAKYLEIIREFRRCSLFFKFGIHCSGDVDI